MSADSDKRRRHLDQEERALWERATNSVLPLRGRAAKSTMQGGALKAAAAVRAHSRQAPRMAEKPVPAIEPLQRRQKQRLARGSASIDDRIDLHGKTQSEAQAALIAFLRRSQRNGCRFVLVITGKGLRVSESSTEGGVLKRHVPLWLQLPQLRPYVVGFEQADLAHGGEGALYVQVRRARAVD
jgi:DNA-nicking Smr family endonuclease